MPALRPLLIAALLLTLGAALPAPRAAYAADVVGSGTSASCIEAELVAKLSGGGSITFNSITIADPQLGALADNGGGTSTMRLPNASPAVGAGNNATCLATDQRGIARPQGARCDIGAFELVLALALIPSFVGAGEPGFTLTVTGVGFSAASKVLWDGDARPTSFVSATTLCATIAAADLSGAGNVPVGVSESTLPTASFRVVAQVTRVYLPLGRRSGNCAIMAPPG